MRLGELNGVELFLAVARELSFGVAAKRLGLSASAVSSGVRKLEEHLGAPLLTRTTRSVALTQAGQVFFERADASFGELEQAFELARGAGRVPSGALRVNLPQVVFEPVIAPRLADFFGRYPAIQLECVIDDEISDIVSQGFDAGVRAREQVARGMVTVRLHPKVRYVVAAPPRSFERTDTPRKPAELLAHRAIVTRFGRGGVYDDWEFSMQSGEVKVTVKPALIVNDVPAQVLAALGGAGLIYQAEHVLRRELASGALVECLARHSVSSEGYFLYFPRRLQHEPKLRAFIDHFKL
jgi:DNA-binding transcriptional LysR family regulator